MKVKHSVDELNEGETMVLTLADRSILDDKGEIDAEAEELENALVVIAPGHNLTAEHISVTRDNNSNALVAGQTVFNLITDDGRLRGQTRIQSHHSQLPTPRCFRKSPACQQRLTKVLASWSVLCSPGV